jgi:hypothetical protein
MTKDVGGQAVLEKFGVVGEGVEVSAIEESFGGDEEGGFDQEFSEHCRSLLSALGTLVYRVQTLRVMQRGGRLLRFRLG